MAGLTSTLLVTGLLAAAADPFSFEGPRARAYTERPGGFFLHGNVPFSTVPEQGVGTATLEVQDRVGSERATYGDAGSLSAHFELGGTRYDVELVQVGLPPLDGAPRRLWHPLAGGVMLSRDLYGDSGLGFPNMTRVHAAAALWGVGRVSRNGQLLTDRALIHAAALSHGAFADDDTHAQLAGAREGDAELIVLAWNLPVDLEPRGFIQFVFDDVAISVDDQALPVLARVPTSTGDPSTGTVPGSTSLGTTPVLGLAVLATGTGGGGLTAEPSAVTAAPGGVTGVVGSAGVATDSTLPSLPGTAQGDVAVPAAATPLVATPGVATGTLPQPQGATQAGPVAVPIAAPVVAAPVAPVATPAAPVATPGVATTGDLPANTSTPVAAPVAPNPQAATPGVATTGQLPAGGDVQGFGAPPTTGTTTGGSGTPLSSIGGFTVVPLAPGRFGAPAVPLATGPGSNDVPGNQREQSPGLPATPPPANSNPATPATPLPATPAPANAAFALPLPSTPQPLNAAPAAGTATPFISTPAPLGQVAPVGATPAVPAR